MRIVVIGGSGHIGTYLVPTLVEMGHEVINLSRGLRQPYLPHAAWNAVQSIAVDRESEERDGTFGERLRALNADVVIDLICFTETSARQIVEALRGEVQHFLHCGTIWVYGHSVEVPASEDQPLRPFGDYGIQKAAIQTYLLREARMNGFPATVLLAGHIVGSGYIPINPQAHLDPNVFVQLAHGETVTLPNFGMETLHHVHASDVAQGFVKSILNWRGSVGENFHIVSPAALTLRGYAEAVASWFGKEATLAFLPWEQWRTTVSEAAAATTWDHIAHSPNASIVKAQRMIDFQPRYSSLQAIHEALDWLINNGEITL